jgi:hypothetical protein
MVRPITNVPGSDRRKSHAPLGTVATVLFILSLCFPVIWYVLELLESYGPNQSLTGLALMELLIVIILLALPFLALRVLRVNWSEVQEEKHLSD